LAEEKPKLSDAAIKLLRERYCHPNEEPKDVYRRVAYAVSRATPDPDYYYKKFLWMMNEAYFLPNSPCIRNAGRSNMNKACFVLPIDDSMQSIFQTLYNSAMIFKEGGGVGYNFSNLRERGAPLSGGGTSSGVMSFMRIYNAITDAIKQGGFRRGASMGILDYDHPEIIDFVREKITLHSMTNFNLSVMVDDDFMKAVTESDDYIYLRSRLDKRRILSKMKARDLFAIICYSAWMCGDPGMLFFNRINKDNPFYPRKVINATNPCGEQPLFPYESCCLGSINLSKLVEKNEFNYDLFKELVKLGTHFLLAVNKITEFPIQECYIAQAKYNRIGLGVMGFADALMKMHIYYDSDEALKFIDKIAPIMKQISRKIATQSVSTLSIAPTGSLSILASCSPSIEPIFSRSYVRKLSTMTVKEEREANEYLRTAHEVSPEWHLKIQARWQKYVDSGVSKTINLPYEATIQDVMDIYIKAWKMGCKGITIFRDKCRGDAGQVFISEEKKQAPPRAKCDGEMCYL